MADAQPFATTADIASTEDKTPGCTIAFAHVEHPFDRTKRLVYVDGRFADGKHGPFPVEFAAKLKALRPGGGAYAAAAGHWTLGRVISVPIGPVMDNTLAWLEQQKLKLEATLAQVPKPTTGPTTAKPAIFPE